MQIDDEYKPVSAFDIGPETEPTLKLARHGGGPKVREYTSNPVGWIETDLGMTPYGSVFTGNRRDVALHAEIGEIEAGAVPIRADVEAMEPGYPSLFRVGSGAQFGLADVSAHGYLPGAPTFPRGDYYGEKGTIPDLARSRPSTVSRVTQAQQGQIAGERQVGDQIAKRESRESREAQAAKVTRGKAPKARGGLTPITGGGTRRDPGMQAAYERTTRRGF